ncbi:metallophosphoesterase [Agrobacterium vitis]|uniref:metallophosphoesterase n=1 Tax=Agrobacterium vitis TaxID=373 RepID=UPI001572A059|nr:metallophosphoesterase [Agrobacterium vitis]NSZ19949.1 serine/threonine protein phosphatase [Agrobacterium vitis]QZO07352.1 metallophosphoesterase [Agrobacterium vitis]UJL90846.1 serine/threonine protein phosphatase [Agrobacterium vitis]BCH61859.1 metallophosphatase [Agrobacterium vitis]
MAVQHFDWIDAIRPMASDHAYIAIGDVHGRADLLFKLHTALQAELALISPKDVTCIHLGDLIDKGPESRRAVEIARRGLAGATCYTLLGNHEDRLLQLLNKDDEPTFVRWLEKGGYEFFEELGISPKAGWQTSVIEAFGEDSLMWLRSCPTMLRFSQIVYVHAGIDTAKPLSEQTRRDLLWVREPWTSSKGPYQDNLAFVHGHSPVAMVDLENKHRINLDTYAVETGTLSSLLIFGDRMKLLST